MSKAIQQRADLILANQIKIEKLARENVRFARNNENETCECAANGDLEMFEANAMWARVHQEALTVQAVNQGVKAHGTIACKQTPGVTPNFGGK